MVDRTWPWRGGSARPSKGRGRATKPCPDPTTAAPSRGRGVR